MNRKIQTVIENGAPIVIDTNGTPIQNYTGIVTACDDLGNEVEVHMKDGQISQSDSKLAASGK